MKDMVPTGQYELFPQEDPDNLFRLLSYGLISAAEAAKALGISTRQVYRRLQAWNANGGKLPPHGNAKRVPVNRTPDETRERICKLISEKYYEFPPSLLSQYLWEHEDIRVSRETLRKLMKTLTPNLTEKEQRERGHLLRRRRSRRGELIQVDGSPHRWFLLDPHNYCLIAFIDDATGMITAASFCNTETAEGYMKTLLSHIKKYGIPLALYSDRHSIFKQNGPGRDPDGETQIRRICDELGIELIYALTPQAKGRVERLFGTLQGRWPLEFRVQGITNIDEANKRLPQFIADYNSRFSVEARSAEDAHSPVSDEQMPQIERICATWHERVMSKTLTVSFHNCILQVVKAQGMKYELIGQTVYVIEYPDNRPFELLYVSSNGKQILLYFETRIKKTLEPAEPAEETSKTIDAKLDKLVDEAMHQPNPFVERHYKEAQKAKEKKVERAKRDEAAKMLEEKIQSTKVK